MQIIPAILAKNLDQYLQDLKEIESCNELVQNGWIQLDFMDGQFVPNKSIEPQDILDHLPKLKIDAHLMVSDPSRWLEQLLKINPQRVIIPVETEGLNKIITDFKSRFIQVGLSLNPETPISQIKPYLEKIDAVLLMSVHPGAQGQSFITETLDKVGELLRLRLENNFLIGVDGGVTADNVKMLSDAGVDYAIVGSHLLKGDIDKNLQLFKKALNE